MRFSMLYSGEQILSFKSCLVFYAGDSLKIWKIIKFIKSSSFNVYSTHLPISHSQVSFTQIILNTYPLSTRFHTFRVKLNRHAYSQTCLWTYIPTFSHLPNSIDTYTDLCQTQPTYISEIPTGLWTFIPTLANQHSSQVTKLRRHTYQTKYTHRCWT